MLDYTVLFNKIKMDPGSPLRGVQDDEHANPLLPPYVPDEQPTGKSQLILLAIGYADVRFRQSCLSVGVTTFAVPRMTSHA
ncbi:MAG: hypothetical protein WBW92_08040 [Rhodanobacteraceae bacterium]